MEPIRGFDVHGCTNIARAGLPRAMRRELLAFVRDGHQFLLVELEHRCSLSGGAVISPGMNLCFAHNARTRTNIMLFYGG